MLINDTGSSNHVGCQAVSNAHNSMIKSKGGVIVHRFFVDDLREFTSRKPSAKDDVYKKIKEVDVVICNGEGTIHHNRGLHLLNILATAQKLGKKTLLLNAVFQSMNDIPNMVETLNKLDDFTVRDTFSSEYLTTLNVKHRLVIDSIVQANFKLDSNCDFSNKILFTDYHPARKEDVGVAMDGFVQKHRGAISMHSIPLDYAGAKNEWQHAVANIRTGKMVITGRHHGVYLAGLAGVPFVACPGNTWKVEGTIKASGLPIPICKTLGEIEFAYEFALSHTDVFQQFTKWLYEQQKTLTTFDAL